MIESFAYSLSISLKDLNFILFTNMKKDKRVSKLRVVEEQQKEHTVSENISDE